MGISQFVFFPKCPSLTSATINIFSMILFAAIRGLNYRETNGLGFLCSIYFGLDFGGSVSLIFYDWIRNNLYKI